MPRPSAGVFAPYGARRWQAANDRNEWKLPFRSAGSLTPPGRTGRSAIIRRDRLEVELLGSQESQDEGSKSVIGLKSLLWGLLSLSACQTLPPPPGQAATESFGLTPIPKDEQITMSIEFEHRLTNGCMEGKKLPDYVDHQKYCECQTQSIRTFVSRSEFQLILARFVELSTPEERLRAVILEFPKLATIAQLCLVQQT